MKENYESFKKELKTKKIAVLGAGVSNIPLLKQLALEKCDVTLFDQKEKENINEDIQN